MMDGTGMMGMVIVMALFGLLLIALLVLIGVAIIRWLARSNVLFPANSQENALEILKSRLDRMVSRHYRKIKMCEGK